VDNNDLDLGMTKSGFIHTLPSGRLSLDHQVKALKSTAVPVFVGIGSIS
jgi:hypothetical protein